MFKKLGMWVDRELYNLDMTRKDLRINFRFRGKRYYIETFNPLWWILRVSELALATAGFYAWVVLMILSAPVGA